MFPLPRVTSYSTKCRVLQLAQLVLIFCFFVSASASEKGQKSHSQLTSGSKESRVVQLKKGLAVVGPNIRLHPSATTNQSEISIITHPTNPDTVLAGWNATNTSGNFTSEGWAYTTDGGANWIGGDTIPTHTNLSLCMSDPAVGIDLDGNLFFNAVYFTPPSTFPRQLFVARSTNHGSTWTEVIVPVPDNKADKDHIAVDVNPGSPFRDYLYTAYTNLNISPCPTMFSRSTDRGLNWTTPVSISGSITGLHYAIGVNLVVSADSELYATWGGFNTVVSSTGSIELGFNMSSTGGISWGTAKSIRTITNIGTLTKGGNTVQFASLPSMAVDRSTGPRRGWIYIVYPEKAPTTPDIFLVRSTDGGGTWSTPRKVNQDVSGKDQWLPWISVDPLTGALYVIYYDSRNFPGNDSAQVYVSTSLDGGETFDDILVSEVPFLPAHIPVPITGLVTYMGDYIGISALNGVVWPCWMDNRTGIFQAYTSRIEFINGCLAKPGDVNASGGTPNLQDVIYLVNFVFDKSRVSPPCNGTDPITCWPLTPLCRGDVNGSGGTPNLQDVIYLVNFVFDKSRVSPPCNGTDPGNCWTPVQSGTCCLP